ncbi:hypothetical protein AMECASPLE_032570, partial [Ameca splendens]
MSLRTASQLFEESLEKVVARELVPISSGLRTTDRVQPGQVASPSQDQRIRNMSIRGSARRHEAREIMSGVNTACSRHPTRRIS